MIEDGLPADRLPRGRLTGGTSATAPSAREDCVRFARESFGALHQMPAGLVPTQHEEAWQEISTELARFEGPRGFQGPCELIVAWAVK